MTNLAPFPIKADEKRMRELWPADAQPGQYQEIERRLAPILGCTPRTVARAAVRYGLRPQQDQRTITDEQIARARALSKEGVIATWIAEDVGIEYSYLRKQIGMPGVPEGWYSVWQEILKSPVLYALHCEFAPKRSGKAMAA